MDVGHTPFPKVVTLVSPSFAKRHFVERARVIISGAATVVSAAFVLVPLIPFAVPTVVVILITVVGVSAFLKLPPLVAYSLIGLLVIITVSFPTVTIAPGAAVASKRPWCSF